MENKYDFLVIMGCDGNIRQSIHMGSRTLRLTHNHDNKYFFTKIKFINHTHLYLHK
jgi:hypothetical protein